MKPQPRYKKGDKIGGRYKVHDVKMGGMGEVYLCLDLEENLPYALKTFQQRYLTNPKLRTAFENEVLTWVALEKHPNIVRCFYMDILDNQPFMLLEWIVGDERHGTDLRSWLQHGPLDLRLALDFTIDVCRGLIHAQEKQPGMVHRDLKPDNILVTQDRLAKITDFGLTQIIQQAGIEIRSSESETDQGTRSRGSIVGTPPYMAPEQCLGKAMDARTDIYAVGCILYELLTGRWPFRATSFEGYCHQHLEADIPKLEKRNNLPSTLNTVVARCLAKRQEKRWATVSELLEALSQIYQQQFTEAPRVVIVSEGFTTVDYNHRGATYERLGLYDKALADYNQAIELDPTYALAYSNRGVTYERLRRYESALRDYTQAIELDPDYEHAYYNRSVIYYELQRYDEAMGDLNQAIELDPTDAKSYGNRGSIFDSMQRYDEALADFTRSIELDSTNPKTYTNRGNTYSSLQRYDKALADHTQAIELDPYFAPAYYNRGNTYYKLQRYHKAMADFTRAIELDPTDPRAYNNRGGIYNALQRHKEAIADFTRTIQLNPAHVEAYSNRGIAYASMQRFNEALADLTKAIEIAPANAKAHLNMGVFLYNKNALIDALHHFEKAAQLGDPIGEQYATQVRRMVGM